MSRNWELPRQGSADTTALLTEAETTRTNLLTYSEDAGNAIWIKSAVTIDVDSGYLSDLDKKGPIPFTYDDWDSRVYSGIVVLGHDATYRMFYTAYGSDVDNDYGPAVANSTDLVTWTKPNVGRIDWPNGSGDTDNNLVIFRDDTTPTPVELGDVIWDGTRYLALCHQKITAQSQLWESPDGEDWTFVSNAFLGADLNGGAYAEPKAILYDGSTYKLYYRSDDGGVAQRRSIGYYESATYNGTYVDQGLLTEFTSAGQTVQYYDMKAWEHDGLWYASVVLFNKTSEVLGPHILYQSADTGATWVETDYQAINFMLPNGSPGSFDDELMASGKPILVGDTWHYIYVGSSEGHDVWPRPMLFAKATALSSFLHKMDRIRTNGTNNVHWIAYNNLTTVSGSTYTYSAFVRDAGAGFVTLSSVDAAENFISCTYNLTTGEVTQTDQGTTSGTVVDSGIVPLRDGIWHIWMVGSHTGLGSTFIYLANAGAGTFTGTSVGLHSHTPLTTDHLLVGGMSCELGSLPPFYVPTTTASASVTGVTLTGNFQDDVHTSLETVLQKTGGTPELWKQYKELT